MTVRWNDRVIAQVTEGAAVTRALVDLGWEMAGYAAQLAPKSPGGGEGARSIQAQLVRTRTGPEVRVSWDRKHFYMSFQEFGTDKQPPRPFLRPAARRYQ